MNALARPHAIMRVPMMYVFFPGRKSNKVVLLQFQRLLIVQLFFVTVDPPA